MYPWVVTELQHIEVPAFHAAPNAVYPGDEGALILHIQHGSHHVLIAMVLEIQSRGQSKPNHTPEKQAA